ncbi:MAG: tetratricopeptide repeat protein [Bacteroidota bacterium]
MLPRTHNICCTLALVAALVLLPRSLYAQQTDAKYRLAQSYEQQGEWVRARPLYESLYQSDPKNYLYFDGLRRAYTQLKQYEAAIALVQQRLGSNPGENENLRAILGSLYYQTGEESRADSIWKSIIQTGANKTNLYRLVAGHMIENRLYDQAIQTYLRARADTGNERVFAEELSWLYSSFQQYALATKELVMMLRGNPTQLISVQSRLASFTSREEGMKHALAVVREEVGKNAKDITMRTLLAWLYMERKDYGAALGEYQAIDEAKNANGQELFNFAQRALQEQAYTAAAIAYRRVINNHPAPDRLPLARVGLARAIEELSAATDSSSAVGSQQSATLDALKNRAQVSEIQPSYQAALSLYDAIIREYPGSEFAAQAFYRVGIIRRHRFFDLDGAAEAFGRVRTTTKLLNLIFDSTIAIGEVLTAKNDLAAARSEYLLLLRTPAPEMRDRALFRLAELDYFEAKFDSALAKIQRLASNITTDLANDALQLQYFIQENKAIAQAALASFAKADLLMRQNKHSEALRQFEEIVRQYPAALLLDDAFIRSGELHLKLQQPDEALVAFRTVAQDLPTSIFRDFAQMRIAEVYERVLNDKPKALEAYETLLAKHPHSMHAEEARKRARILRGDNL